MRMNTVGRLFLIAVALLVALPMGWFSESHAQSGAQGSQGTTPGAQGSQGMSAPAGMQQEVQGAIKSLDPSGRMLTLDDGTQLTIPPTINVPKGMLKEGAMVKASFEERGGEKVVTSLEVHR
jgi:Protein of unknown function (DUF1344)